jgi:FMN-dependent dehydrogenase
VGTKCADLELGASSSDQPSARLTFGPYGSRNIRERWGKAGVPSLTVTVRRTSREALTSTVIPLVNLVEYQLHARDIAEGSTLDFYDGGSNDEITLRENAAAFSRITLYPRMFRGVGHRDTSTTVLGMPASTPIIVAPVALIGMLHSDGEVPVVRAASKAGSIVTLSTFSVTPVEDVVAAAGGPVWFQLYVYKRPFRDRSARQARRGGTVQCARADR